MTTGELAAEYNKGKGRYGSYHSFLKFHTGCMLELIDLYKKDQDSAVKQLHYLSYGLRPKEETNEL